MGMPSFMNRTGQTSSYIHSVICTLISTQAIEPHSPLQGTNCYRLVGAIHYTCKARDAKASQPAKEIEESRKYQRCFERWNSQNFFTVRNTQQQIKEATTSALASPGVIAATMWTRLLLSESPCRTTNDLRRPP